ncbi:MAG TPA: phospholipase D-like domain-containing protein [Myxococcales bacterium]
MRARLQAVLSSGKRILEQIRQASRTLELVTPYVRGAALEDALVNAPARRKRLLTRYRPADILSGATDVAMLGRLRRKLEVRVIEDVQARAYIVDGRWAYVGSCALTPASLLDSGADMGVAVCDEVSLRLLYAQFAQLWTRATEMTAAQWMLAQHAADGARDSIEAAHRDLREAERALGRFVEVPRLRAARRNPGAPERRTPAFVRRRMEEWAGSAALAHQVADFLGWTLASIPYAEGSAAWTVLLGEHSVRVKLGVPEIFSIEESEEDGARIAVMGLDGRLGPGDRPLLHSSGAVLVASPYASASGLTRDAVRISFSPRELPQLRPAIEPALAAYLELQGAHAATVAQRWFASSVLEYLEDELDRALPWPRDTARPLTA